MNRSALVLVAALATSVAAPAGATSIVELLVPPDDPRNAWTGTFLITPSEQTWAFGVGNPDIEDTSISGISFIDGLDAGDHWISALIARGSWDAGFDFDSIRPIGADAPSSFSIDTTQVDWQWGDTDYVAFYWLSEANEDLGPAQAVLQAGTEYDAFKFFTSGPASPFAAFTAADGGDIVTGETQVVIEGVPRVPEPTTLVLVAITLIGIAVIGGRRGR